MTRCSWLRHWPGPSAAACLAAVAIACHSPGPYGHSKVYSPLDEEETALARASEYDPVMSNRRPEEWQAKRVALFGVVEEVKTAADRTMDIRLSLRHLEPRNLCSSTDEDTCRVTVSDREHGKVHAVLAATVPSAERAPPPAQAVRRGSLLRIVGALERDRQPDDGLAIVRASYLRHWPAEFFVTSQARQFMLR